jgi:hypothetical protein
MIISTQFVNICCGAVNVDVVTLPAVQKGFVSVPLQVRNRIEGNL